MEFRRYTPELVRRWLAVDPEPPVHAASRPTEAAVLWADISGFTRLTERLVAHGLSGVERLTEYLNDYFGELIDLVVAHGGDIVQFAGDALLAVWTPATGGAPLDELTFRATQCALAIQRELVPRDVEVDLRLTQRVAVDAGTIHLMCVGGVLSRWEIVASGAPLARVCEIDVHAAPGEVVVAAGAWSRVAERFVGKPLTDGVVRIVDVRSPTPPRALSRVELPAGAEDALRVYLAGAVLTRVRAGQSRWLAELRGVSVLFVRLPDIDPRAPDVLDTVQGVVEHIQHAIYRWGGSVDKIGMADKGVTLLAGFGVPPLAHEDDPTRAVRAALDLRHRLEDIGVRSAVGVTTGQVFCGLVGNTERCEYTTMGRAVNLASRLMQLIEDGVLCDAATWRATRHRVEFEELEAVTVKGVPEPVALYRPTGSRERIVRDQRELVGRKAQLDLIADSVQAVIRRADDRIIVIEGEAGIGKSRLTTEAVAMAHDVEMRVVVGEATAIERDTPYFAWRGIFYELFALDLAASRDEMRERVWARLGPDDTLEPLAPLLNAVLPLELPDSEVTAQMSGEVRAHNTHRLLARLLERAASESPLMLVVEDAHWLDSASWTLVEFVGRDVRPMLQIVVTRPLPDPKPAPYLALVGRDEARRVCLEHLTPEQTQALVCQRLGVVELEAAVGAALAQRSGGNPFSLMGRSN